MKVTIDYQGLELDVYGEYEEYQPKKITLDPYYSEPEEGGFDLYRVMINNVDITDWLNESMFKSIANATYTELAQIKYEKG